MKRTTLIILVLICKTVLALGQNIRETAGERQVYDSAHYSIIRRKYITGEKYFESYTNNHTKLDSCIEYYKNGRLKEKGVITSVNNIYIGIWKYYSFSGKIIRIVDYNKKYRISYYKAIEIAREKGFIWPDIEVEETSFKHRKYWEISRCWSNKTNNNTQVGEVLLISKTTGKTIRPNYKIVTID